MDIESPADGLYGRYDYAIDDKFRIVVPLRFREHLGAEFILTQGPSKCIRAYPKPVWAQMAAELRSRTILDEYDYSTQMLQRMIGSSEAVTVDSQNRITIPRVLKDWAEMTDQEMNTLLGTGLHVEFWKKSNLVEIQKGYSDIAFSDAKAQRIGRAFADIQELGAPIITDIGKAADPIAS